MSGQLVLSNKGTNTVITAPGLQFSRSLKPLRNKFGPCEGCGTHPSPGRIFAQCGGCKAVLYCSTQCQVANWSDHKHYKFIQQLEEAKRDKPPPPHSGFPVGLSVTERMTLLFDFMKLHDPIIKMAVHYTIAMTERERGRSIDFNLEGASIRIQYRPDNNGNPARAFALQSVGIVDMLVGCGSATAEEQKQEEQAWRRMYGDGRKYPGRFSLMFAVEEIKAYSAQPHKRPTPETLAGLGSQSCDWVKVLSRSMETGVVWCSIGPSGQSELVPGEMRRVGTIWHWTQIPKEGGMGFAYPVSDMHDALVTAQGGVPASSSSGCIESFLEEISRRQDKRRSRRKLKGKKPGDR